MFFKKKNKTEITKLALMQALGILAYISFISLLFWKGNEVMAEPPRYLGPVMFLTLFSTSAMICGLIMFYNPFKLYLDKKVDEAIKLVFHTVGFLALFVVILFTIALSL